MIATVLRPLATWLRYRAAVRQLANLDDRTLRDIGINRTQIRVAAWNGTR